MSQCRSVIVWQCRDTEKSSCIVLCEIIIIIFMYYVRTYKLRILIWIRDQQTNFYRLESPELSESRSRNYFFFFQKTFCFFPFPLSNEAFRSALKHQCSVVGGFFSLSTEAFWPKQTRLFCFPFWQSNFIKLFNGGLQYEFIRTFWIPKSSILNKEVKRSSILVKPR